MQCERKLTTWNRIRFMYFYFSRKLTRVAPIFSITGILYPTTESSIYEMALEDLVTGSMHYASLQEYIICSSLKLKFLPPCSRNFVLVPH